MFKYFTTLNISKVYFFLCISLFLYVKLRLLDLPLERDEGEYALMGKIILEGGTPYLDAKSMKLPGVFYIQAFFQNILGSNLFSIKASNVFFNLLSAMMIFVICRHYLSKAAAYLSSGIFLIFSMNTSILGQAAHATHFINFFSLTGFYFYLKSLEKNNISIFYLSGLFFSIAIFMKQHALFYILLFGLHLVHNVVYKKKIDSKYFYYFILGAASPFLSTLILYYFKNNLSELLFWTIEYPRSYVTIISISDAIDRLYNHSFLIFINSKLELTIIISIVSAFLAFKYIKNYHLLHLYSFASILSIFPGLYFRPHYFITLLPAISILYSVFLSIEKYKLHHKSFALSCLILLFGYIYRDSDYIFISTPNILINQIYSTYNPFLDSVEISDFLIKNKKENEKLAILGSEPQIYFYSDFFNATSHIYTYPLMEAQKYSSRFQHHMIYEIMKNEPEWIIDVTTNLSWLFNSNSDTYIFEWKYKYIKEHYYSEIIWTNRETYLKLYRKNL